MAKKDTAIQTGNETDNALEAAGRFMQSGDLEQAAVALKDVLLADPGHFDATLGLAIVHATRGDLEAAIPLFEKAASIRPDDAETYFNLGLALTENGRLDDAVTAYRRSLDIDPNQDASHINLGTLLIKSEDVAAAADSFRRATEITPDHAEAHCNLGNALAELERLEDAVASYHKALALKPDHAEAHSKLGNALTKLGRPEDALACHQKALALKPDHAEAHINLGNALTKLGRLEDAVASYQEALALKPDYSEGHYSLGIVLQKLGRFEDAIRSYDLAELDSSRGKALECLFILEKYEEFYLRLDKLKEVDKTNIDVAAISAFVSHQLGRENPYPFCKTPLDFLRVGHISNSADNTDDLIDELIEELRHRYAVWEPYGLTTKFGFQTRENLFLNPKGCLAKLDRIIKAEINSYYTEHQSTSCSFMELWPRELHLQGWFVRLLQQGHQKVHNHPSGWLSGVIYLKLPETSKRDEGAIEFVLHGYDGPILNDNYPRTLHHPDKGQIVLFPSSLFHKTVPFSTDDERLSVAFDLLPGRAVINSPNVRLGS